MDSVTLKNDGNIFNSIATFLLEGKCEPDWKVEGEDDIVLSPVLPGESAECLVLDMIPWANDRLVNEIEKAYKHMGLV